MAVTMRVRVERENGRPWWRWIIDRWRERERERVQAGCCAYALFFQPAAVPRQVYFSFSPCSTGLDLVLPKSSILLHLVAVEATIWPGKVRLSVFSMLEHTHSAIEQPDLKRSERNGNQFLRPKVERQTREAMILLCSPCFLPLQH